MTRNGFTLIEALITTVILVTGLTALAGAFSYSSLHTLRIQQQTAALALLSSKLEELKVAAQLPPGRHSEYLQIAADGAIVAGGPGSGYKRTWEITAEMPSRITVIILGKARGRGQQYFELARATTKAGSRF